MNWLVWREGSPDRVLRAFARERSPGCPDWQAVSQAWGGGQDARLISPCGRVTSLWPGSRLRGSCSR